MKARNGFKAGFTLVEILIVVVILGILAAIVIPQFTNASENAKGSSLVSQLQTIRSQLELYQVQHNGTYPDLVTSWDQFTLYTDDDGNTNATKTDVFKHGPYMQQAPRNPLVNGDDAAKSAVADGNTGAWDYDETTGSIKAVLTQEKADALNIGTNDFTVAAN